MDSKTTHLTAEFSKEKAKQLASGLWFFFGRTTPDSQPGRNTLTLSQLPSGTTVISVWITEWIPPNNSHAKSAFFYTSSVQLYNNGTNCRVVYDLDWNTNLPTGYQVILG